MKTAVLSILSKEEKKLCEQIADGKTSLYEQDDLYNKLYDHYVATGEMPYDVQKARKEDPMTWIANQLEKDFSKLQ